MLDKLNVELQSTLVRVSRRAEMDDFGEKTRQEMYDEYIRLLEGAIMQAKRLRDHEHKYDGDDICEVCGKDGRA